MGGFVWTEDVAAFAELAATSLDPGNLTAAFTALIASKGMRGFACGEIDLRDLRRTVMVAADWPADWMDFYSREGLVQHDPAVSMLGRHSGVLSWANVRSNVQRAPRVRRALDAAEDYGWRDGLFIPIPRGGSRWGLATVTGLEGELSPAERSELGAILILFYERMRGLLAGRPPMRDFSGLSPRELDCLALVAHGLNDQAIGDRLGIARTTAHDYVERAKRRLHVRTRTEAVAIAVSMGLVAL